MSLHSVAPAYADNSNNLFWWQYQYIWYIVAPDKSVSAKDRKTLP
jgi:hypothetical protein